MTRRDDEETTDKEKTTVSPIAQRVAFAIDGTPVGDDKDEEVGIEEDRATLAPRGSFVTADGDVVIPNGGKISFFDYLRLAEAYDVKIRRLCGKLAYPEQDEDNEFLESTHLILYKWRDYFQLPKRFNANFLYGKQVTLADGTYDPNDNNRTLLGFRNPDCLFVVILAYIVLIAELGVLIGVVYDLLNDCSSRQKPAGFCALVEAAVLRGETKIPSYFNSLHIFKRDIEVLGTNKADKEAQRLILLYAAETFVNDLIVVATTLALQLCNVLLLTTVAIVMASSPDLLSMIQNFVSVEIVVHIHEFIPRAMRIVDRSPGAFNASFVDWYKELERVNLLSEFYPQTTRRIRRAPDTVYRRVFLFFCLYTLIAFSLTRSLCNHS